MDEKVTGDRQPIPFDQGSTQMRKFGWAALLLAAAAAVIALRWLEDGASETSARSVLAKDPLGKSARSEVGSAGAPANPSGDIGDKFQTTSVPSDRSPAGYASAAAPAQLTFQVPQNVRVGDAFDLVVDVDSSDVVSRLELDIKYDPAALRLKNAEEIDYSRDPNPRRRFSAHGVGDGRVTVGMPANEPGQRPLGPVSLAVAQFEALSPGLTHITISETTAGDQARPQAPLLATPRDASILVY
jgi:hypothetical protein